MMTATRFEQCHRLIHPQIGTARVFVCFFTFFFLSPGQVSKVGHNLQRLLHNCHITSNEWLRSVRVCVASLISEAYFAETDATTFIAR